MGTTVFRSALVIGGAVAALAVQMLLSVPVRAQGDSFETEFEAWQQQMQAAAAPADETPAETPESIKSSKTTGDAAPSSGEDEDVLITNVPASSPTAGEEVAPPETSSPGASPAVVVAPVAPSAVQPPPQPVPQQAQSSSVPADPLAPFRAQQAIREAERRLNTPPAANNPLGLGGQLPVGASPPSHEELQAEMEAEALLQQERLKKQAFDAALDSLLPLSPDQTRSLLDAFRSSREAAETPVAVPKPRMTVETVPLDPSQPPLQIMTAPGYVTTLTILDATGAPWAIQDISWAGKFEVTTPEEGGHVLRITPMSAHGVGNISIRLVDLITPVTFSLATGLDVVDFRFDARIPRAGPLARTPLIESGGIGAVAGGDDTLMRVLDGTALTGAERMKMEGVDGGTTAYRINDTVYLRTPLTLLSPSWQSSATSADGMNVYTLRPAPVILLSDRGRMVKARLRAADDF